MMRTIVTRGHNLTSSGGSRVRLCGAKVSDGLCALGSTSGSVIVAIGLNGPLTIRTTTVGNRTYRLKSFVSVYRSYSRSADAATYWTECEGSSGTGRCV